MAVVLLQRVTPSASASPSGLSSAWRPGFTCATHRDGLLERREASGVGVLVSALLLVQTSERSLFRDGLACCLGSDKARTRDQTRCQGWFLRLVWWGFQAGAAEPRSLSDGRAKHGQSGARSEAEQVLRWENRKGCLGCSWSSQTEAGYSVGDAER